MRFDISQSGLPVDSIRQQLARILADPLLSQSQRLSVLLRFLVEATLDGRAAELKEFVIGAEALGRGAEFDPQADNIVRVTAARLRSRLSEYYQGPGKGDPVIISIPKGAYVPSFSTAALLEAPARNGSGFPGALSSAPLTVGRIEELNRLQALFETVAGGANRVAAITGEAGAGKTTLAEYYIAGLAALKVPCWVMSGRCSERLSKTEPLLPILECLDDLLQNSGDPDLSEVLANAAPAWFSRLDPPSQAQAPVTEYSAERYRREMVRVLRLLGETKPVVIFLDDLHWADASTIDLLIYVTSHVRNLRLFLVTAYRASAILSAHPFIALKLSLERRGECEELAVGCLSAGEVSEYIDRRFPGHDFSTSFISAVWERTEGHPLFLADLLRFLQDRGVLRKHEGRWGFDGDVAAIRRLIPSGVQNMIRLQIAELPAADREILECAAVCGITFPGEIVATALARDIADVEECLGRLALSEQFVGGSEDSASGPIHPRFLHVLYQNALYTSIPPARRASLSKAVANALMNRKDMSAPGMEAGIAMLWEFAGDGEKASIHFLRAARHVVSIFAYPEARLLCERGMSNLMAMPESPIRDARELDCSLVLGLALMVTTGYASSEVERVHRRSYELCLRLDKRKHLVPVLWGIHTCVVNAGELTPALKLAQEMASVAESQNNPEFVIQALHALGTTLAFMGRLDEARNAIERCLELWASAERKPRPSLYVLDTHVTSACMLARVLARQGLVDRALSTATAALAVAEGAEHPPSIAYAQFWVGWVQHARKEFEIASVTLELAMDLSRKHGLPQFLEWGRVVHGSCLAHLGSTAAGIAEIRLSLENQLAMRSMLERPFCLMLLAEALSLAGAHPEALRYCDEAIELGKRTGADSYKEVTLALRAALRGRAVNARATEGRGSMINQKRLTGDGSAA